MDKKQLMKKTIAAIKLLPEFKNIPKEYKKTTLKKEELVDLIILISKKSSSKKSSSKKSSSKKSPKEDEKSTKKIKYTYDKNEDTDTVLRKLNLPSQQKYLEQLLEIHMELKGNQ